LERREFSVDLLQLLLVRIRQFRARTDEILIVTLQQIARFRVKSELLPIGIKLLDACEKLAVQKNRVVMRR